SLRFVFSSPHPPTSTLFPYTTLFRSWRVAKGPREARRALHGGQAVHVVNAGALERRVQLRPEIQRVELAVQERSREPVVEGSQVALETSERAPPPAPLAPGLRLQDIVPSHGAAQRPF